MVLMLILITAISIALDLQKSNLDIIITNRTNNFKDLFFPTSNFTSHL